MPSYPELLNSFIGELERVERRIAALIDRNEAILIATRTHLHDSAAQLVSRRQRPQQTAQDKRLFFAWDFCWHPQIAAIRA